MDKNVIGAKLEGFSRHLQEQINIREANEPGPNSKRKPPADAR